MAALPSSQQWIMDPPAPNLSPHHGMMLTGILQELKLAKKLRHY
jgi:hypothetical protein